MLQCLTMWRVVKIRGFDTGFYKQWCIIVYWFYLVVEHFTVGLSPVRSRRNSETGYGLDAQGSIRGRGHRIQTVSGAHPAPYAVGTRGYYPGSKAAGS
jgi:hypothetical protein